MVVGGVFRSLVAEDFSPFGGAEEDGDRDGFWFGFLGGHVGFGCRGLSVVVMWRAMIGLGVGGGETWIEGGAGTIVDPNPCMQGTGM